MGRLVAARAVHGELGVRIGRRRPRREHPVGVQAARGRSARNGAYPELGGNGIGATINYERFLADDFALRLGVGLFPWCAWRCAQPTFVIMASWLGIRSGGHGLELGLGVGLLGPTATVGYRYAPLDGGFAIRVAFTPFWVTIWPREESSASGLLPWGGVALGLTF